MTTWTIRRVDHNHVWRVLFAVFVDARQRGMFGQLSDGRWRVLGGEDDYFLTRRAARDEALRQAGVPTKVPDAFYR